MVSQGALERNHGKEKCKFNVSVRVHGASTFAPGTGCTQAKLDADLETCQPHSADEMTVTTIVFWVS